MTNSLTSKNSVTELLRRVPDFEKARSNDPSCMSHEDDSPYLVFGDFGLFLLKRLKDGSHNSKDQPLLREAFGFLDEMLTSTEPELINLAQVGVIEVLADSIDAFHIATSYLSPHGKAEAERFMR
ncbi:MAG TPA: hypothetical protein VJ875_01065 [Pyrinomonadaceae bacterium]|nr:hypothetical protein [Pyrinomonadaceae bacterium]